MSEPAEAVTDARPLRLAVGCEFDLRAPAPTSAVLQVAPHEENDASVDAASWDTANAHHRYVDRYGNQCERFELSAGVSRIVYQARVSTTDRLDDVALTASEIAAGDLPDELLHWVMPSRFCQPDELGATAWQLFGDVPPGWTRVQAVCDFVHDHLEFLRGSSNPWTTAADAYRSRQGVCRDFAHLAITFCRALNIPARYVFGYLPDIGLPPPYEPMDFAAWFEVYLAGRWYTFDARNNEPRVGRVVVGRGRDAVDVAMMTSFGSVDLVGFRVQADRIE
jgi:transglutaminase-like putative cysteine protease